MRSTPPWPPSRRRTGAPLGSVLAEYRKAINKKLQEATAAKARYDHAATSAAELAEQEADCREALALAQTVAQQVQEQAHRKIADVVSQSLEAIFEEPYDFQIKFEQKRRLLILDEPFSHLSAGYCPRMRALINKLAEELDVQFAMVTHQEELKTGTVIEL